MSAFCLSFSSSRKLTFVDMTLWLSIAVVSVPLIVASRSVTLSFVSPVTDWTVGFLAVLLASSGGGALFLATACAYVFDRSTIVKPSWVISATWEAFWKFVRRGLPSDGANPWALVTVVLTVVRAVPFFAKDGVFECVDVSDVDALSWFEFMITMCRVRGISDEVGESNGCGRSVLVSVEFVGLQVGSFTRLRVVRGFESLTCVKVGWP